MLALSLKLAPGARVILYRLNLLHQYNGLAGTVKGFHKETQKWDVRIHTHEEGKMILRVPAFNCRPRRRVPQRRAKVPRGVAQPKGRAAVASQAKGEAHQEPQPETGSAVRRGKSLSSTGSAVWPQAPAGRKRVVLNGTILPQQLAKPSTMCKPSCRKKRHPARSASKPVQKKARPGTTGNARGTMANSQGTTSAGRNMYDLSDHPRMIAVRQRVRAKERQANQNSLQPNGSDGSCSNALPRIWTEPITATSPHGSGGTARRRHHVGFITRQSRAEGGRACWFRMSTPQSSAMDVSPSPARMSARISSDAQACSSNQPCFVVEPPRVETSSVLEELRELQQSGLRVLRPCRNRLPGVLERGRGHAVVEPPPEANGQPEAEPSSYSAMEAALEDLKVLHSCGFPVVWPGGH